MGENSAIGWTTHTLNPWIGCHKISPACKNCYAAVETFTRVQRGRGLELWGANAERHVTSDANWRKPLAWNRAAEGATDRPRVFCASLSDVLEVREGAVGNKLDDARARLWDLIEATPNLDWLLLSKRWGNAPLVLPERWRDALPRNVWCGATVEDQEYANERVPLLLSVPAVVHFLSVEPMLGPVDLAAIQIPGEREGLRFSALKQHDDDRYGSADVLLDWVIVGFESGPGRRPRELSWMQGVVNQCAEAGVPVFVKQDTGHKSGLQGEIPDALWALKQFPKGLGR